MNTNSADVELQQQQPTDITSTTARTTSANESPKEGGTFTTEPPPAPAQQQQQQQGHNGGGACSRGGAFRRDGRLLLITLFILILMNVPFVRFLFWPFDIFSTWIHEVCHGIAAVMIGGSIVKLEIFPDTSGLATTTMPSSNNDHRGFVVSAGYQGTAVTGCLLLLIRRTKRGPRTGTMMLASMMLLSVILWIRNAFGVIFIAVMGLLLGLCAWRLQSTWIRNLYIFLAVTTTMNAITSIQNLFGSNHTVNGQDSSTDAQTMADIKGGSSSLWACLWLVLGIIFMILGIVFAIPGPDEVADFTCCGVCQDLGLFQLCNYPGQRLFSGMLDRWKGRNNNADNNNNNNANETTTTFNGAGNNFDCAA